MKDTRRPATVPEHIKRAVDTFAAAYTRHTDKELPWEEDPHGLHALRDALEETLDAPELLPAAEELVQLLRRR